MPSAIIGILIKILAVAFVLAIAALVKIAPKDMPISEMMFFRCMLAIPFVLGYTAWQMGGVGARFKTAITPKNYWLHIRRSTFGMISMALIFGSVRLLPLPIANALKELSPILITLFAALFLGETIRIYRTAGLLLGVLGVAIITYQSVAGALGEVHGSGAIWGVVMALSAAVTIALAQIQIRSMIGRESPPAIVLTFFLMTSLVCLFFAPFGWVWPESGEVWLILLGIGICGAGGQLAITFAYRFAEASTIAPFEYFSIPFAIIVGGFVFQEWPSLPSLIGMAFILVGGVIIIYRENQIARGK